MENNFPTIGTNSKPSKDIFVISFRDAYHYLASQLQPFDNHPEFTFAVLTLLTNEALDYSGAGWATTSNSLDDAIDSIVRTGCPQGVAYEICRITSDLIYTHILQVIPDYGARKYDGEIQHQFRNEHDVVVQFRKGLLPAL